MTVINAFIKWFALLAVALSAGLLMIIFLSASPDVPTFLLRILILLAVAFMGGFSGRLFFHALPALALICITLAANLLGMLIIDHFYTSPYRFAFLSSGFTFRPPSVSDFSQLLFILLVSMLPLLIFRRSRKKPPQKKIALPNFKNSWQRFSQRTGAWIRSIHPKKWGVWKKIKFFKKNPPARAAQTAPPHVKPANATVPVVRVSTRKTAAKPARQTIKTKQPTKLRITNRLFGKPPHDVRLVGEEEHVCPYCLDEVKKNDSRGVEICRECGTWHHQDCWNLTGACGVAHRNEL